MVWRCIISEDRTIRDYPVKVIIVKITEKHSLSWDEDRRVEVVIQPFLKR